MSEIELYTAQRGMVAKTDPAHLSWLLHNFAVIKEDIITIIQELTDITKNDGDLSTIYARLDTLEHDVLVLQNEIANLQTAPGQKGDPGPKGDKGDPGPPGIPGSSGTNGGEDTANIFDVGPYAPYQIIASNASGTTFINGPVF